MLTAVQTTIQQQLDEACFFYHIRQVSCNLSEGSSFLHWVQAETTSGYLIEKLMEEREENCSSFDDGLA